MDRLFTLDLVSEDPTFFETWSLTVHLGDLLSHPGCPWHRGKMSRNPNISIDLITQDMITRFSDWQGSWSYKDLYRIHGFLPIANLLHRLGLWDKMPTTLGRWTLSEYVRSLRELIEIDARDQSNVFLSRMKSGIDLANPEDINRLLVSTTPEQPKLYLTGKWDWSELSSRLPFSEIVGHPDRSWSAHGMVRNPGFLWGLLLLPDPRTIFPSLLGEWDWETVTFLAPSVFIQGHPNLPWVWSEILGRSADLLDIGLVKLYREKTSDTPKGRCHWRVLSRLLSIEELNDFDEKIWMDRHELSQNPKIPIAWLLDASKKRESKRTIHGEVRHQVLLQRANLDELSLLDIHPIDYKDPTVVGKATIVSVYCLWDSVLSQHWGTNELIRVNGIRTEDLCRLCGARKFDTLWGASQSGSKMSRWWDITLRSVTE